MHVPGFHFGGPTVAYATFILLFSSVTCEFAHHFLQHHKVGMAKLMFVFTIILGIAFLGFQGYEWGDLIQRGFTPLAIDHGGSSSFAAIFYTGTGFHGLHVSIGLVMLFMVLMRLEAGHFAGKRHFAAVAASWYWHFVDIVWVLLFITVYVVG
jgi:cytochrome c oxidase subunit 3